MYCRPENLDHMHLIMKSYNRLHGSYCVSCRVNTCSDRNGNNDDNCDAKDDTRQEVCPDDLTFVTNCTCSSCSCNNVVDTYHVADSAAVVLKSNDEGCRKTGRNSCLELQG